MPGGGEKIKKGTLVAVAVVKGRLILSIGEEVLGSLELKGKRKRRGILINSCTYRNSLATSQNGWAIFANRKMKRIEK